MIMPRSQPEARSTPTKKRPARKTSEAAVAEQAVAREAVARESASRESASRESATREAVADGKTVAGQRTVAERKAARGKVVGAVDVAANVSTSSNGDAVASAAEGSAGAGAVEEGRAVFLGRQRILLLEERATYTTQAEELKAQADSLALEHEPGDVQFDEEGGEGGTSNVDRELDLILSAQARASITEIDLALGKIDNGTYGICEQCGDMIPDARLEALPHASLCVACKSGGLSSRR
jgi:DnaK suppressor protein